MWWTQVPRLHDSVCRLAHTSSEKPVLYDAVRPMMKDSRTAPGLCEGKDSLLITFPSQSQEVLVAALVVYHLRGICGAYARSQKSLCSLSLQCLIAQHADMYLIELLILYHTSWQRICRGCRG